MTLHGHIKGKFVEIDSKNNNLPDGTPVEIIPVLPTSGPDSFCGKWKDDRSAEDIVKDIRKARLNKNRNIDL